MDSENRNPFEKKKTFFFNQWKGVVSPATVGAEHRKPHWGSTLYLRRVQPYGYREASETQPVLGFLVGNAMEAKNPKMHTVKTCTCLHRGFFQN